MPSDSLVKREGRRRWNGLEHEEEVRGEGTKTGVLGEKRRFAKKKRRERLIA